MSSGEIWRLFFLFLLVPFSTVIAITITKTWISEDFRKMVGKIPRFGPSVRYLLECMYCMCGWVSLVVTARYTFSFFDWLLGAPRFGLSVFGYDIFQIFDFLLRWGILWGACMVFYVPLWIFLDRAKPKRHIQLSSPPFLKSRVFRPEMYDIAVIGGGVTGAAQAYVFSHFMKGVSKVLLLEKNPDIALVNSNTDSNAQTLHGGDTETNFSREKALKMRDAEKILGGFLEKEGEGAYRHIPKMAYGIGKEVKILKDRFDLIHSDYETLRLLKREEIMFIEPKLLEGLDPNIEVAALYRPNGFSVDYHKVAKRFAGLAEASKKVSIRLKTRTRRIIRKSDGYEIRTNEGRFKARAIAIAAGPYSLLFAHSLGYAGDYTILPVAGGFYRTKAVCLKGKVYTVQDPMFPFAAAHMDPSVDNPEEMRIGPTADIIPFLERYHWTTFIDFLKTGIITPRGLRAILKIFWNRKVLLFAGRNIVYKIPIIGKWYFLAKAARKIVPTLKYGDLEYAKGEGGIRPQLVNMKTGMLEMGTGKIIGDKNGDKVIFDITPSPGASDCLRNAIMNAKMFARFLGSTYEFDDEKFIEEFPETKEALTNINEGYKNIS